MEHERLWRLLAERAATRKVFFAYHWVAAGHSLDALPDLLDCSPVTAWRVCLAFPPRRGRTGEWVQAVSRRFALDPGRVRRVVEQLAPDARSPSGG